MAAKVAFGLKNNVKINLRVIKHALSLLIPFRTAVWYQDPDMYHMSLWHASHHLAPVPASPREVGPFPCPKPSFKRAKVKIQVRPAKDADQDANSDAGRASDMHHLDPVPASPREVGLIASIDNHVFNLVKTRFGKDADRASVKRCII